MGIEVAIEILKKGGVIGFPTETVYGIGCDINNLAAVNKIFELKGRERTKPLAAHVGSIEQIEMVAETNIRFFEKLSKEFLPGPLALILPKKPIVDNVVTCGFNTISIRFPDCKEAIALALGLGRPIAATSANLSSKPSAIHHNEVKNYFGDALDYIIEAGVTKYRKESTIIDLCADPPKVLRVGAIPVERIEKVIGIEL
jgi:L-threonylcarbamoyladenylate synthase